MKKEPLHWWECEGCRTDVEFAAQNNFKVIFLARGRHVTVYDKKAGVGV